MFFHTFLSEKGVGENFAPKIPLYFGKAFEVPRNFSRKVSCVGVWGGQPQHSMHTKKHGNAVLLFFYNVLELRSKPCFKGLFVKSPLKIRQNFPQTYHFILAKLLGFQRTFREKFLVSGSHSGQPQLIMHNNKLQYKYNDCTNIYK